MNQTPTHKIIRVEADETASKSLMWRCLTDTGEKVNCFKHTDPFKDQRGFEAFDRAGYMKEMLTLPKGNVLYWKKHPIAVTMTKEPDKQGREWWAIVGVEPRPADAVPDAPNIPDAKLFRQYAITWAKHIVRTYPLYIDTETTGTRDDDELISIALVGYDGQTVFNSLLKPAEPERLLLPIWGDGLTPAAKTGITPDMLADMPTFGDVYNDLSMFLVGNDWVIYNAAFDTRLITQTCLRYGMPPIPSVGINCAMEMYAAYAGEWDEAHQHWKSHKLEVACEALGVEPGQSHDALADALMLHRLVRKMAEQ